MKNYLIPLSLLLALSLTITGCGKKAEEETASPESAFESGSAEPISNTYSDLIRVIKSNDVKTLRNILSNKNVLDLTKLIDGETLMTIAVENNLVQMVEALFENSTSLLFKPNSRKQNPLMVAAREGHETLVRVLMSMGLKPDNKDIDGNTALHLALMAKKEDLALFLINADANYEITNNANQTPLSIAQAYKLDRVVKLIQVLSFSHLTMPDKTMVSQLILEGTASAVRKLIGDYPSLVHEYKDLNFYVMIQEKLDNDKSLAMAEVLALGGADVNGPRGLAVNPLILAVKRKSLDFVTFFLKYQADLSVYDLDGKTALIHAIEANDPEMVKALFSKNAQERYTYFDRNQKKRTMNACTVARDVRRKLATDGERASMEEIMEELGCGLRWLF
jgi:ankyrin repeat protein